MSTTPSRQGWRQRLRRYFPARGLRKQDGIGLRLAPPPSPKLQSLDTGRLRILHLDNIAGNAYLGAKLLNERGHVNHVASPDLYHFASTPEWHDLSGTSVDRSELGDSDYFPD